MPKSQPGTCNRPDRDNPKLVCGYPLPCPHHTVILTPATDRTTLEEPGLGVLDEKSKSRVLEIGDALSDPIGLVKPSGYELSKELIEKLRAELLQGMGMPQGSFSFALAWIRKGCLARRTSEPDRVFDIAELLKRSRPLTTEQILATDWEPVARTEKPNWWPHMSTADATTYSDKFVVFLTNPPAEVLCHWYERKVGERLMVPHYGECLFLKAHYIGATYEVGTEKPLTCKRIDIELKKCKCDCCERGDEYNGFRSGTRLFTCPKGCACHD